ncbi:PDZ domain-containing protein [Nakamurella flavida]|uniref:PDZ domain-containing protein n=1 Tax=Nakamurella flavida TaxID=363630 RepID=A0A938YQL8_9ACTN|nr:PDZ domain-containing protein [Nakamurella flavida]MBM9477160.1 PDZ domain-containing protein [Nakamurella flavida]MDP9780109.1 PDZ domain-containing protein [Nakamurella flavida]
MSALSRMSLRGRTLVVGSAAAAVLVAAAAAIPVPYVALGPGETFNTLTAVDGVPVISLSGPGVPASADEAAPAEAHLNMTTVSVLSGVSLFQALGMWASGDYAVVPREDIFPPDQTVEQVNEANAQLFSDSQSAAEIAALTYLDYPEVVYAGTIPDDSPSAGVLQPQDRIVAVDGAAVTDAASLRAALAGTTPGQTVQIGVLREADAPTGGSGASATGGSSTASTPESSTADPSTTDSSTADPTTPESSAAGDTAGTPTTAPDGTAETELTVPVTLAANAEVGTQGFLGILPQERPQAPFTIDISLANIGGPSAGLMFTLGIIDKLTPGDLTDGRFIAGTGTMEVTDDKATVGPIGGILLKMIAAREAGAGVFLVPAANCTEALTQVPDGLQLVKVGSLDEAMQALTTLSQGGVPAGC